MRNVKVESVTNGFKLVIDGKPLKTPLGIEMVLPGKKLAEAIAAEWQAQGEKIRKHEMRLTQLACVAKDIATVKREVMLEDILTYAETDLLCYRAGDIPNLYTQQHMLLTPFIALAKAKYGILLQITDGIMPVKQPPENRQKIKDATASYNEWQLAVFATVVKPLSSIILALLFTDQKINAQQAFRFSHLEETYQTGKWGEDEEKEQKMAEKKLEIEAAGEFLRLLSS